MSKRFNHQASGTIRANFVVTERTQSSWRVSERKSERKPNKSRKYVNEDVCNGYTNESPPENAEASSAVESPRASASPASTCPSCEQQHSITASKECILNNLFVSVYFNNHVVMQHFSSQGKKLSGGSAIGCFTLIHSPESTPNWTLKPKHRTSSLTLLTSSLHLLHCTALHFKTFEKRGVKAVQGQKLDIRWTRLECATFIQLR